MISKIVFLWFQMIVFTFFVDGTTFIYNSKNPSIPQD